MKCCIRGFLRDLAAGGGREAGRGVLPHSTEHRWRWGRPTWFVEGATGKSWRRKATPWQYWVTMALQDSLFVPSPSKKACRFGARPSGSPE